MTKNNTTVLEPAFPGTDRCIVFAANAGYMPLTSVAVRSIIDTRNLDEVYDIIVLHRGVPKPVQDAFCSMASDAENVTIRFYDMEDFVKSTSFYVDNRPTLSAETYFRLYIPWVLSNAYHTALYLDGDMLITKNINDIFAHDTSGYEIAAVRDYWGIVCCYMPGDGRRQYRERIGLSDVDNYIIAGTIIYNLHRFSEKHTLNEIQKLVQSKNWMQHDQDVINILCQHAILHISPDWGMMDDYGNFHYLPRYMQDELAAVGHIPAVIHYGGDRKPYTYADVRQGDVFWKTSAKTPFFEELLQKIAFPQHRYLVAQRLAANRTDAPISVVDAKLYYNGILVGPSTGDPYYRTVRITDNRMHIQVWCGQHDLSSETLPEMCLKINGRFQEPITRRREDLFGGTDHFRFALGQIFDFEIDLARFDGDSIKVEPHVAVNGATYPCTEVWYEQSSAVHQVYHSAYYISDGWMVVADKNVLTVTRCSAITHLKKELLFCREIWKPEGIAGKKALVVRTLSRLLKMGYRKPIWLIYDAHYREGDAAETFFRYLATHHSGSVMPVFAVNGRIPEFAELQKYGRVIPALSHQHKLMVLLARRMITDDFDDMLFDLFERRYDLYRDLSANTPVYTLSDIRMEDETVCRSVFDRLSSQM